MDNIVYNYEPKYSNIIRGYLSNQAWWETAIDKIIDRTIINLLE